MNDRTENGRNSKQTDVAKNNRGQKVVESQGCPHPKGIRPLEQEENEAAADDDGGLVMVFPIFCFYRVRNYSLDIFGKISE